MDFTHASATTPKVAPSAPTRMFTVACAVLAPLTFILGLHHTQPTRAQAQATIPNTRIALPALNGNDCEATVRIQNVGDAAVKAMLVLWGEPSPLRVCDQPSQAVGPLKVECTGLIRPGTTWQFSGTLLLAGAHSAIAYALNATDVITDSMGHGSRFADLVCDSAFATVAGNQDEWLKLDEAYRSGGTYEIPGQQPPTALDFGAHSAEPLAISVDRSCPDPGNPTRVLSESYAGQATNFPGMLDARQTGYTFFVPVVAGQPNQSQSVIHVQNTGNTCTHVGSETRTPDCARTLFSDDMPLAPGESRSVGGLPEILGVSNGSVTIDAAQPLAIVVDTLSPGHFSSYGGVPRLAGTGVGSVSGVMRPANYAPIIYKGYEGWDTVLKIMNQSWHTAAKVSVSFFDRAGNLVATVVTEGEAGYVCPRGTYTVDISKTAIPPDTPILSARIESLAWWAPGTEIDDLPQVQTVVQLVQRGDPGSDAPGAILAYNAPSEQTSADWKQGGAVGGVPASAVLAIPSVVKGANDQELSSELGIVNLVSEPGYTDFAIFIFDQNGLLDYVCWKLKEEQVEYFDLRRWDYVNPGFKGGLIVSAFFWEHEMVNAQGTRTANLVGLGAVTLERARPMSVAQALGAVEAVPIFETFTYRHPFGLPVPQCSTGPPPTIVTPDVTPLPSSTPLRTSTPEPTATPASERPFKVWLPVGYRN